MDRCNFPEHHTGNGPGFGWVAAVFIGAAIVTAWRAILVTVIVCGVLAVAGVIVLALYRSARSAPYDASWSGTEPQEAPAAEVLQARVVQLERQLAERQAIAAPVTHQHLHLHGVEPSEVAAIVRQHNAIEEN